MDIQEADEASVQQSGSSATDSGVGSDFWGSLEAMSVKDLDNTMTATAAKSASRNMATAAKSARSDTARASASRDTVTATESASRVRAAASASRVTATASASRDTMTSPRAVDKSTPPLLPPVRRGPPAPVSRENKLQRPGNVLLPSRNPTSRQSQLPPPPPSMSLRPPPPPPSRRAAPRSGRSLAGK
ncbi:uncharacterized protein [Amphiura filiformis]|uniref:uncharacterized protein n=1 Tax=Amphiura filiformis TaxID=82378 RepID=UPI003B223E37